MVFGDRAPPALQWWAPWVHTVFFAAISVFLTIGATSYELPVGRGGGTQYGLFVTGMFWLATAALLVRSVFVTIRHLTNH